MGERRRLFLKQLVRAFPAYAALLVQPLQKPGRVIGGAGHVPEAAAVVKGMGQPAHPAPLFILFFRKYNGKLYFLIAVVSRQLYCQAANRIQHPAPASHKTCVCVPKQIHRHRNPGNSPVFFRKLFRPSGKGILLQHQSQLRCPHCHSKRLFPQSRAQRKKVRILRRADPQIRVQPGDKPDTVFRLRIGRNGCLSLLHGKRTQPLFTLSQILLILFRPKLIPPGKILRLSPVVYYGHNNAYHRHGAGKQKTYRTHSHKKRQDQHQPHSSQAGQKS